MSTGYAYRALETTNHDPTGAGGFMLLGGAFGGAVANYVRIVDALKKATGQGTGPWSAELTIKDASSWECWKVNVEEGTGPSGEDKIRRDTGTLQRSSNSDANVDWGSSVKDVFITPDAKKGYALFDALTTAGYIKRVNDQSYSVQVIPIPLADGGTNATTASDARTQLGVAIGSNVQAWDADLDTIAALAKTDGYAPVADGSVWTLKPLFPFLRGWIDGFRLSRSSATVLNVSAGVAISEDSANKALRTTGTETVTLTVSGVGGLGVSRTTDTWYHVFAIYKDSDGTTDVYADTSVTAANKPAGYSSYRRLGSFRLNATGSGELTDFSQNGDEFLWRGSPSTLYSATNPGTSAVTPALHVPPDVKVDALFNFEVTEQNLVRVYVSSLDAIDEAPSETVYPLATSHIYDTPDDEGGFFAQIRTDVSRQIRYRLSLSDVDTVVRIATLGWIDARGRNA